MASNHVLFPLPQQNFLVGSVNDIVPTTDELTEFFELVPSVMDIEFITVSPDVKNLGVIRFQINKGVCQIEKFIHIFDMMDGRIEPPKIVLNVKIVSFRYCP
ncbi:hypothetical protein SDC9_161579 [bioreactor metagenome]|uniref:Uncharacterized protein n=1 Tax=bioreactor metagenome TaxID=1076179 RepID=A0A645FQ06_9ZZZZ